MAFRRKNLLKAISISSLASLLSLSSPAAPRLAFQVYAVRDMCEKDFAGTLKAAKALGFEGVETGRFFGLDAKALKTGECRAVSRICACLLSLSMLYLCIETNTVAV